MDLPPVPHAPNGAGVLAGGVAARHVAGARESNRACCAADAARLRWVARIVEDCRAEVRERVLALGDSDVDVDAEEFAHRMCVDTVMCVFAIGTSEATRLVNLADRLAVLPAVWDAWAAGVLDTSRVRVLAGATEVLDDATARAVATEVLAWAGDGPVGGPRTPAVAHEGRGHSRPRGRGCGGPPAGGRGRGPPGPLLDRGRRVRRAGGTRRQERHRDGRPGHLRPGPFLAGHRR
jgi:hypothetical protein